MKDYDNKVYKASSKKRRASRSTVSSSVRKLIKSWRQADFSGKNKNIDAPFHARANNDLLDLGKDTHLLTGNEKEFYAEQFTTRLSRLSE